MSAACRGRRVPALQWSDKAMQRLVVGYGEFSGYSLQEVPDKCLSELAGRFPLSAQPYDATDG